MKILSWLIFAPFALLVVIFAVSNRADITVDFWPLPFNQDIPLYLLSLGTLAFGFFFGALLTWLSVAKWRVIAASRKKDTFYAEEEIKRLNQKIADLEGTNNPSKAEVLPALKTDAA
jgi:lipopolysaccharide assembly protein A